jgi:RNA polymerase sigma-70 factor (ECF subfamily)
MANAQSLHALLDQTGWIHALAQSLVSDPHLAADLAQDTTVDALEVRPDGSRPLRGWLATVMRNNLAKLRRGERNRSAREASVKKPGLEPAAHEVVERAETHRNVVLAVLALDEPYRSTLLMRFFEQLPYDEIARQTGVTRAAVNSRITRGLAELRQRLENTYGGDRRALALALLPLAKLPTAVAATTTTILGLKTMHFALGTAAATLLVATVSVSVLSGGREPAPSSPATAPNTPAKLAFEERELVPLPFFGVEPEPAAPARVALEPQEKKQGKEPGKKHDHKQHESDENVWKTELFHSQVLPVGVETLSVNTGAGDVEVLASTSGKLEVQARVRAKLGTVKDSELTQIFEDHVDIREEDGRLIIEDGHKNQRGWTVSLAVSVPGSFPVLANSGAGDVLVRTGKTKVQANSGAGDVRVELPLERLKELQANSGAGNVVAEVLSIEDELLANSGAGNVVLRVVEASSPGSANLNSGAGDVRIIVPANMVGSFDLETFGDIEAPRAFGLEVKTDVSGQKKLEGSLGAGGGRYKLRSGAGDLAIVIGNALPVEED